MDTCMILPSKGLLTERAAWKRGFLRLALLSFGLGAVVGAYLIYIGVL